MMKKALLILAGAAVLAGCSCKTAPQTICSSYRGILPAADAAGIVTTLTFDSNGRYLERNAYLGKTDGVFNEHGNYSIKNNVITTVNAAGETDYYRLEKNQIRRLDAHKKTISGSLAGAYVLPQTAGCVPFGNVIR